MSDAGGRVVLLSGAGRGIGLATARALADAGWRLSLGLRRPTEVPAGLPADALAVPYEAADPAAARAWVAATLERFGRIDAVVASAAAWLPSSLEGDEEAAIESMWRVNVLGPLRLVRAAWAPLKACGRGRVVALSSLSGKRVAGGNVGYAMSKFALQGLVQQIRRDGFPHGIRATALAPGFVATDMAAAVTDLPAAEMTQPEDLARVIALLLDLPNTASVPELVVNFRYEAGF